MVKWTTAPTTGALFESVAVAVKVCAAPAGFETDVGESANVAGVAGVAKAGPTAKRFVTGLPFWSVKKTFAGAKVLKKSTVFPGGVIVVTSNITVIDCPGCTVTRPVWRGTPITGLTGPFTVCEMLARTAVGANRLVRS